MSKDDNRRYLILKDKNIYKGLILLSLPLMFNNIMKTIHDLVDMYFVSRIVDHSAAAVSSISITFPVLFTFISLGIGLGVAGTALISQLVGNGQTETAKEYATNLLTFSIVVGVILNIVGFFGAPYIMSAMGAEGYMLEKSTAYLQIRSFELISVFVFFAYTSIRQAAGDTLTPVIFGVITMVVNIILSPIFILLLNMGVEGAAYATLVGNTVLLPFILYQLFFSKNGLRVSYKKYFYEKNIIRQLYKTALPASTGQAITAIGFILMNTIIIRTFDTQTVAAFSVGNRVSSLVLHPVMAIGGVVAAYIGQNIGNLNPERAKEAFYKAMKLSVGIMIVLSTIMLFIRVPVVKVLLENDVEALELAVKYTFYLLIGLPFMAVFQTFIGAYNGNGKTGYTFIVGVTRLWILRIPLIFIFTFFTNLGSSGIWYAMLMSNFIIMFIAAFFYKKLQFKPNTNLDI